MTTQSEMKAFWYSLTTETMAKDKKNGFLVNTTDIAYEDYISSLRLLRCEAESIRDRMNRLMSRVDEAKNDTTV